MRNWDFKQRQFLPGQVLDCLAPVWGNSGCKVSPASPGVEETYKIRNVVVEALVGAGAVEYTSGSSYAGTLFFFFTSNCHIGRVRP